MNIRQAIKIRDRIGVLRYSRGQRLSAARVLNRNRQRKMDHDGIRCFDPVTLLTDTGVDEDGVPTSVAKGGAGYITDIDVDGFPQVLCKTWSGLDVIGIPIEYLERRR